MLASNPLRNSRSETIAGAARVSPLLLISPHPGDSFPMPQKTRTWNLGQSFPSSVQPGAWNHHILGL